MLGNIRMPSNSSNITNLWNENCQNLGFYLKSVEFLRCRYKMTMNWLHLTADDESLDPEISFYRVTIRYSEMMFLDLVISGIGYSTGILM